MVARFGIVVALFAALLSMSMAHAAGSGFRPGQTFEECTHCPQMTVVPAGHFKMLSRLPLDGRPDFLQDPDKPPKARAVTIPANFALGTSDVTRGEYAQFVRDTNRPPQKGCYTWDGEQWIDDPGKSWENPGFSQTDRDPVVCVSWEDAQAYVRWLNSIIRGTPFGGDGPYRLPSLAEEQYAAAAGATTHYYWGDAPRRDRANYGADGCLPCKGAVAGADRWFNTSPVGSFPPNAFGLKDMAGNVSQLTDQCFEDETGVKDCGLAVLFGGSWRDSADYLRLSETFGADRQNRNTQSGFRIARDLSVGLIEPVASNESTRQGREFRDCPHCPLMRVVPPGHFDMVPDPNGAVADTHPPSKVPSVRIDKPFAVGVYDVTRAEFATFVKDTGWRTDGGCQFLDGMLWRFDPRNSWQHPGFAQTVNDPVVCVSWNDAQAYVRWLNAKVSGKSGSGPYRLPSGAEWIYAARGGLVNPIAYYWGHVPSHDHANFGLIDCWPCGVATEGRDRWEYTSPVGSFPPNEFGLYDMVGNAWQWSDDCGHTALAVTSGGSPWTSGDCRVRILYGGSYDDLPFTEQVDRIETNPNPYPVGIRNYANGFRVVRDLD